MPLTGQTPAATYPGLLYVSPGLDGTLRRVFDGLGTSSPLQLSTDEFVVDQPASITELVVDVFAVNTIDSSLIPTSDNTYSLGSPSFRFASLYVESLDFTDPIPIESGGTGADNAPEALLNLLPDLSALGNTIFMVNNTADGLTFTPYTADEVVLTITVQSIAGQKTFTDPIVLNGGVNSSVIPTTSGTRELGTPTSRWADFATVDLDISGFVTGSVTPATDLAYNLGTALKRWNTLFSNAANINFLGVLSNVMTSLTPYVTGLGLGTTGSRWSTAFIDTLTLTNPLPAGSGGTGASTASANSVFAGPTTGSPAAPAFRALVVADIPTLTSAKISDFDTQVRTSRLDQMAAPTADVSMNGHKIINLATPTLSTDAVNKNYADGLVTGLIPKTAATVATAAALPASTYDNGTAGLDATLTGNVNGALTVDTYLVQVDNTLLVIYQDAPAENGLYVVTDPGDGSNPFVLTRHISMDSDDEFHGSLIPVEDEGDENANSLWLCTNTGSIVTGTDPVTLSRLNKGTDLQEGVGITISGNTVSLSSPVAIANGGTGQTSASAAFDALAPDQTGNDGKFLTTNAGVPSWATIDAGTVTSVDMSIPDIFDLSGAPITTAGSLDVSLADQAANTIFAGPVTGADDTPAFRSLVLDDLPTITSADVTYDDTNTGYGTTEVQATIDLIADLVAALQNNESNPGTRLISGGGVFWTSGYSFNVSSSTYLINGQLYSDSGAVVTLDPADSTFDRLDVIILTTSGPDKITGAASAVPSAPVVDPQNQLLLTTVSVPALSSDPGVTNDLIYNENAGSPTEWDATSSDAGRLNLSSSTLPYDGAVGIEGTLVQDADYLSFVRSTPVDINAYASFVFFMQSKVAWSTKRDAIAVHFYSAGVLVGGSIVIRSGDFTYFDSANTSTFQQVVIPILQFHIPAGTMVDEVRMSKSFSGSTIGFFLDAIYLQTAGNVISGLTLTQGDARYLRRAENLADVTSPTTSFDNISPMTALGDTIYGGASGTRTRLAGNISATRKFLQQTGTGAVSAAPTWDVLSTGDIPDLSPYYQPLDSDLTALAALSGTGIARRTGAGTWSTGTTVSIGEGGTGQVTAADARVALLPALASNALNVLRVNAGETDVEWAAPGGGGGTPGGADTQVQFNNSGAFGGSADFTWDGTNLTLGASKNLVAGGYLSGSNLGQFTAFTGPITSTKTFTLPNASATILTTNAAVTIGQGGTGQTTQTAAFDALSPMTTLGDTIYGGASGTGTRLAGNTTINLKALTQTGNSVVSAAPVWTAVITSVTAGDGSLTPILTASTGVVDLSINLAHSNTWTAAQIFSVSGGGSVPLTAKADASQSVSLFELKTSGGTVLDHFDKDGYGFPMPLMFNLAVGVAGTTGTKMTVMIVMPLPGKIIKAWIIADTAPTGADFIVDINKGDGTTQTTIWATQANRLKLVATNKTGNQTSFDTTTFAAGDVFSIDVDQIGTTIAGQDIGVVLYCEVRNGP